ncbi:MAG: hypothetical protein PCFJNLEI_01723 [Verrucomicrobiae bacterium]|nr:hypothetical protein [Verrucomicrobiae bacterium]
MMTTSPTYRLEETADIGLAQKWLSLFRVFMLVGAATLVAGALLGGDRFWSGLLLVSVFLVGLGLAGGALIAFEYLSGAGWSVAVRRVPEAMTSFLPWGGLGVLLVLVLHPSLYPWMSHEHHFAGFKAFWLNRPFFLARAVAYLVIWIGFTRLLVRNSRQQDLTGDARCRQRNVAVSAAFTVLFALTVWLASVDWLMSLEPEWFSTIYGVLFFSGLMSSGLATVVLFGLWLRRLGPWRGVINEEHLQDLGKLLLTFCTFWAYIWFSQYMLIWYANIPEETGYYIHRVRGAWGSLTIVNLLLNWAIPFFVLLPRNNKRNSRIIGQVAVVVLVGRLLDLYLMIVPANREASALPDAWVVGLTLGLIGVAGTVFWRAMKQAAVVPVRDPLLGESLHYHQ